MGGTEGIVGEDGAALMSSFEPCAHDERRRSISATSNGSFCAVTRCFYCFIYVHPTSWTRGAQMAMAEQGSDVSAWCWRLKSRTKWGAAA